MKKIILITLFSLVLASCISHRPYPVEWSPLKSTKDDICPDISGTYDAVGESWEGRQEVWFSDFLFNREMVLRGPFVKGYYSRWGKAVKITHLDKGLIEISLWKDDVLTHRQVFSQAKKAFTCSSEGIKCRPVHESDCFFLFCDFSWKHFYLHKSTDGSLVLKEVTRGLITMLIPVFFASEYVWYRFEPVNAGKS